MLRKCGFVLVLLLVGMTLSGFSSPTAGSKEGGNPWWIWILVLLALILFGAVVLWWWLRASGEEEEAPVEAAPARVAEPTIDDLKRIEGIGPKIAGVLQAAGIATFAQLAASDVERLRQVLEAENPNLLRLADPTTWPEQARLAAAGDWEGFEALQGELKGGRRA